MPSPQKPCPSCGTSIDRYAGLCRECRYPNRGDDRPFPMGGAERKEFGCTCTFENERGQRLVLTRTGSPMGVLREVCEQAFALDETFRLITYSSPETIFTDLQGHRMGSPNARPEITGDSRPPSVEAGMLSRIGMRHMLHPRLVP